MHDSGNILVPRIDSATSTSRRSCMRPDQSLRIPCDTCLLCALIPLHDAVHTATIRPRPAPSFLKALPEPNSPRLIVVSGAKGSSHSRDAPQTVGPFWCYRTSCASLRVLYPHAEWSGSWANTNFSNSNSRMARPDAARSLRPR